MPLPEPKKGEKTKDFISRGMSSSVMKKEFPDTKQRLAVLYNIARESGRRVGRPKKTARTSYPRLETLLRVFQKG